MLLALMSDTHDNEVGTKRALEVLAPFEPGAYLHAGDLVAAGMLELFRGLPLHFVFGNNEWDLTGVRTAAKSAGVTCHDYCGELEFGGKRVGLLHGHEGAVMRKMIESGRFDYVVHGHTHVRRDERVGKTRVINPGALQRARVKTVALLETETDELRFIEVA